MITPGPATHPLPVREHQLSAKRLEQRAALHTHGVWHGQQQPVALGRRYKRKPNAHVPTGWLHLSAHIEHSESNLP